MQYMTKWDYINLISKRGSSYGEKGGVLDLLEWCNKANTASVTMEEAKDFWENFDAGLDTPVPQRKL